jgi:hypothetical protein
VQRRAACFVTGDYRTTSRCNSDARSSAVDWITTMQEESKSHHALSHCKPSCCDFTTTIYYTEGCSTNN